MPSTVGTSLELRLKGPRFILLFSVNAGRILPEFGRNRRIVGKLYCLHCYPGDRVYVELRGTNHRTSQPLFRYNDRRYHGFSGFLMKPE